MLPGLLGCCSAFLVLLWGDLGQDANCGALCGACSYFDAECLHSWSKLKLDEFNVPEFGGSVGEESLTVNARGEGKVSCRSSAD